MQCIMYYITLCSTLCITLHYAVHYVLYYNTPISVVVKITKLVYCSDKNIL